MKISLPRNKEIEIEFDDKVYSPAHSSIDTIVLADAFLKPGMSVADVGCGSGVIALSLKKLKPGAEVTAIDIDQNALFQTETNAEKLKLDIEIECNDLLDPTPSYSPNFDMVVANLPSFDKKDMKMHTLYGPEIAYFADNKDGLKLHKRLFKQIKYALRPGGFLIMECPLKLQDDFRKLSQKEGLLLITRTDYSFAFIKPLTPA